MKLFNGFEAVKFPQENMIFIAHEGFLYYIYNSQYQSWRKHQNAGNDRLTVSNYDDVSKEELMAAMNGVLPESELDFMRLCSSSQLCIRDMLSLLKEDYAQYMSEHTVFRAIHRFLLASDIRYRSYEEIRKLLDTAVANWYSCSQLVACLKELSLKIIGRDVYKREIGIIDGHNSSSYFVIMPVRIIDYDNTSKTDNFVGMRCAKISIEEDDVAQYLTPFLYEYFDDALEANRRRIEEIWIDDDGNEQIMSVKGFAWYLTHNFFTFDSMAQILKDIADTVDALSSGKETKYTGKLEIKESPASCQLLSQGLSDEEVAEDAVEAEVLIDFYQRFLYRMEYMMKVGKEKGYNLISFVGP